MKLSRFFELVRRYGVAADPRSGKKAISGYADSAILNGAAGADIRKILVGIDIDTAELLLADKIRQSRGLDLVLSHHPQGKALAGLYGVMQMQVDILRLAGVPERVAQGFLNDRKQQVMRRLLSGNHDRVVDSARALKLPFVCAHTPADNHVFQFVSGLLDQKKPRTVQNIIDILLEVPEYQHAQGLLCGPRVILGNPRRAVGKMLIEMTGGTEGSQNIYKHLYGCGVRTLVSMHLSEDHLKVVNESNLNVVIAGHISSDTLGMNLLLDNIEKHGQFDIMAISGFTRIKRRRLKRQAR